MGVEEAHDLLLVPGVVTAGEKVHPGNPEFVGGLGGQAEAVGGVLPVGDDEVQAVLFADGFQMAANHVPARFTDDVPDEEEPHENSLNEGVFYRCRA